MPSQEIDKLLAQRQNARQKNKKSQMPYAVGLLIFLVAAGGLLWTQDARYPVIWGVGAALGYVLRSSRFCFVAAFRDPLLLKNTKLMRAMILALAVSSTGFLLVQQHYLALHPGADAAQLPGILNPVGLHTVIGAFLFGIGMVLAGGCASGVLMRIGEGHALPWVTLLGFLIGTTWGAKDYPAWYHWLMEKAQTIYLPNVFGTALAFALQMGALAALYGLAAWYQKKHSNDEQQENSHGN